MAVLREEQFKPDLLKSRLKVTVRHVDPGYTLALVGTEDDVRAFWTLFDVQGRIR